MPRDGTTATPWRGRAWPAWARWSAAALVATSRSAPPALAIAFALGVAQDPRVLLGLLVALCALPAAAAWLLARACAATLAVGADVVVAQRDRRTEVARAAIASLAPWRVPLPGAGVAIALRSGARLGFGLEPAPPALLDAIDPAIASHPNLLYAAARRDAPLRTARHPLVRFGLFGLVPAAVLFRAHQVIGFGGLFGQWYMEGAGAWLASLAATAGSTLLGLALYASLWRLAGEIAAWAAAWLAPRAVRGVRAGIEWVVAIAYYAGVPAFLALRFLA